MAWLADSLKDEAEDREEESGEPDDEGVPLVPVQDLQAEAVKFQTHFRAMV